MPLPRSARIPRVLMPRVLQNPWAFFFLAALTVLMSAIDGTIVAVALPTLIDDLGASLVWAAWTITAYALTQTVMLPMAGKLGEQFGQIRVFVIFVLLFTVGSLLCGLAPNVYVLIGCRIIQALGGGGFFPVATGIVAQQFPQTRSRMIGLFASIFPIGGIIGPNLGGAIIEHFGWRDIFLINVPLGILVVALLAPAALAKQPARPTARRQIDVLGTVLFTTGIVTLLMALTFLGNDPGFIASPVFWLLIVGSIAVLGVFAWQEQRAPDPILDLSLVIRQPFLVVNVFGILTGACFMGFFSFIPYYATVQYGMGPLESGAILTPRSIAMIVVSTSVSFLLPRLGYRLPMFAGMACITVALFLLGLGIGATTVFAIRIDPLVPLLCIMAISGLGMGMLIPSSNNAGLDLLPRRAAVVSGIRGLFNSTGGVIGTAIIVLWLELSPDKAVGMQRVFIALAVIMVLATPLVFLIPDGIRERRRAEVEAAARAAAERIEAERAAVRSPRSQTASAAHAPGAALTPQPGNALTPQPPLPQAEEGEQTTATPSSR